MAVRKKLIRERVEMLLSKYNVENAPVPIEEIIESLGIEIKFDKVDDDISGFLFRDIESKRTIIGANKRHHINRQRFTLAHELGHYFLHEGETVHVDEHRGAFAIDLRDPKSAAGVDDAEREANLFAAELLMPAKFLANDLQGMNLDLLVEDDKPLEKLAKKYRVSVQALTFRLTNLRYISI